MQHLKITFLIYSILALLLASCSGKQTLRGVFKNQTPYERYVAKLKDAKLDQTALGQDWLTAGKQALQDSIIVALPFKETGYFSAEKPKALGYRIDAKRGERITVNLEMKAREAALVFLDIFEAPAIPGAEPDHVASADTLTTTLTYEVEEDLPHILRVQPELLRGGQYTVTIKSEPTLAFPVAGKSSRNIASVWGDSRDGGARRHEGIDVFAPRGTPALASAEGLVTRVSTTPRGGKVVWVSDFNRRQNLYYAHLDSQLVSPGQRVQPGDTIGFIGNTGNAKTTKPHLHFGIYRSGRGATNPYPYVHASSVTAPPVKIDATHIGNWIRIAARSANVRLQPNINSDVYTTLPQHTPLLVTGGTTDWYRIRLPHGKEAYVASSLVEATHKPINSGKLSEAAPVLDQPYTGAPAMDHLKAGSSIAVMGKYKEFSLIKNETGMIGWLPGSVKLF
ncbi:peptidoglycan DD-metalloendopeptidase family protein [Pontibacter locisalis]|uniref:Peptidoglycan DD-metalloendopeptidase family protein n=1 Tax=Pontibacter locisalis TaxID=1719035 RepID=A0ABW5IP68_9BACT